MKNQIIVITPETIEELLEKVLEKYDKKRTDKKSETTLFTINKVAKILGVSHSTVKNLVENETIKTTPDNKITEKELNKYLADA